ncbi:MAG: GntR family transcriptional regulator [Nocardioidaceae bacterium]|nr:GntR family transcriptional regulator [Nocardioidaceae bacterium]
MTSPGLALGPAADDIRRRLLDQIGRGQVRTGDRLGAERDLAQSLGVSRSTVRQALAALEVAGFVRRVPGRGGGTFVRQQKVERDLSQVVGVPALLRQQGMKAGSRVVSTGLVAADEEAVAALALPPGSYVIDIVRIRLADGTPISLEHVRLPAQQFPGLLDLPLGESLYELLEEHYATAPAEAVEHIEVTAAAADEATILGVETGSALLSITRTAKDAAGRVFEYSHDLFRADRTVITVRTPVSSQARKDTAGHGRVVRMRPRARP